MKNNFNLEIAEKVVCYVLLYLCEKMQILRIALRKDTKMSGNSF